MNEIQSLVISSTFAILIGIVAYAITHIINKNKKIEFIIKDDMLIMIEKRKILGDKIIGKAKIPNSKNAGGDE